MVILTEVKKRLGITYTDTVKDSEITGMIAGAKAFLASAGWPAADLVAGSETDAALEAVVLFCKMAQQSDAAKMQITPMLIALISQARNTPETEESEDEDTEDEDTEDEDTEDEDTEDTGDEEAGE